jgi:hypothetical protein
MSPAVEYNLKYYSLGRMEVLVLQLNEYETF